MRASPFLSAPSLALGALMMMVSPTASRAEPVTVPGIGLVGWISIEPEAAGGGQDRILVIAGQVLALRPVKGRYSLEVRKKGRSVSTSRQGGAVELGAGETTTLSRNAVNVGAGDSLEVELKVFEGEQEVFSATLKPVAGAVTHRL